MKIAKLTAMLQFFLGGGGDRTPVLTVTFLQDVYTLCSVLQHTLSKMSNFV